MPSHSELHAHHLLVGLHRLVAHRQMHSSKAMLAFSVAIIAWCTSTPDPVISPDRRCLRLLLQLTHLADRVGQQIGKRSALYRGSVCRCRNQPGRCSDDPPSITLLMRFIAGNIPSASMPASLILRLAS